MLILIFSLPYLIRPEKCNNSYHQVRSYGILMKDQSSMLYPTFTI